MNIHKNNPNDPFAAFCVCLGFSHLICQKHISNRNAVVIQVIIAIICFRNVYLCLIKDECIYREIPRVEG